LGDPDVNNIVRGRAGGGKVFEQIDGDGGHFIKRKVQEKGTPQNPV